ncbi:hypothetical protein EGI20_08040 [Aquitalea sp. S1-19]|nr:hypothetical protein [Aquitalea sp. S1-19]
MIFMLPFNEHMFNAGLERLRKRFLAELPLRLENIQQALDASYPSSSKLTDELHRLAGAAGSLGFTELGDAARKLERQLQSAHPDQISLLELQALAIRSSTQEIVAN